MKLQQTAIATNLFLAMSGAANATVLTFDIIGNNTNVTLPQDYGDQVTSTTMGSYSYGAGGGFTPNVNVTYSGASGNDLTRWTTGYSDIVNVIENEPDGAAGYSITFTADPGFEVSLSSLDMGNFGPAITVPGLSITDGGGAVLYSVANIVLPANSDPSIAFSFPAAVQASTLNLYIDTNGLGGFSDNVGLDNIQFSQVSAVPVPAAAWLFGSGVLGLVGVARCRKA